jgi:hypothetical protein
MRRVMAPDGRGAPGHREVRVELRVPAGGAPSGGVFTDEHLSVRWDGMRGVPWRDSADVLWLGLPLRSRRAADAWARWVLGRHPGALVACAAYGDGHARYRLAVAAASPALTAYVRGCPGGSGSPCGCRCGSGPAGESSCRGRGPDRTAACALRYGYGCACPSGCGCPCGCGTGRGPDGAEACGDGCGRGCAAVVTAVVGSLLHACVTARLPLDRPLSVEVTADGPGGAAGQGPRWAVQFLPEPPGGSESASAPASPCVMRAATLRASGAPTPS